MWENRLLAWSYMAGKKTLLNVNCAVYGILMKIFNRVFYAILTTHINNLTCLGSSAVLLSMSALSMTNLYCST